jgi:putative flippase GtrA
MTTAQLSSIRKNKLFRYIIIGGVSYIAEVATLWVLVYILHIDSVVAVAISFWVGLIISFFLQKFFAFRNTSKSIKHFAGQSIAYGVLVGVNYLFTIGFVYATQSFFGLILARTIALAITTGWNFIIYNKIIFKA